jgi:hypothetical protein
MEKQQRRPASGDFLVKEPSHEPEAAAISLGRFFLSY